MKVVIVGGVAGGATAAARIRRLDETAEIVILEKSGYISYANCGLPYYIGDVIKEAENLTIQTPDKFWSRFRIRVEVNHEVTDIDPEKKTLRVKDLKGQREYEESYDKLILSPGAKPLRPDFPGGDSEKIFSLRTVEDTLNIHRFIEENKSQSAVIVGGGYIGIEVAENLREKGLDVTIIQKPNQLMNTIDYDMASFVHKEVRSHGVNLKLNSNVTGFAEEGDQILTLLEGECGQEKISSDLVLLSIGVQPENELAKKAGLDLGLKGSILVNDKMETSKPDIYAVGDAIQVKHFVTEEDAHIALAGPANKQGRIVADNVCGGHSHYQGSMGTSIIKIFDLTVAATGLTERGAKAAGLDYEPVFLFPLSHAEYFPGARAMAMKIIYEKKTMRILGGQILGAQGVDKRLDVLAVAIHAGVKADKLKDLDLAYAPPFSSAKDPINMAGFIVENIEKGLVQHYYWHQVEELKTRENVTLLDVRMKDEYDHEPMEGYINIPLDDLRDRIGELDPKKPLYVTCQSGLRGYVASRILSQKGFEVYNLTGGYMLYASLMREKKINLQTHPCGKEIFS
ncbi:MAG: FAD-dependent oxidoreductase [Eubacterium sp.]|nr:FAD-dependent oxidoreductase [Eubacterium sp.]